jgi:vacuolar-type H+-ATPase subunit I/STV1
MASVVDSLQTELEGRMEQYSDDFSKLGVVSNIQMQFSEGIPLTTSYSAVLREKLAVIENHYKAIDMRWTTFIQAMQIDIADNEDLMDQMTKVNLVKQEVSDTINSIKLKCQALTDFVDARQLIMNQDSTYKKLYKAALKYSLAAKLATKLEKVKATEQNLSGKIQTSYAKAKQATELLPMLNKHMGAIDDKYANLQVISKKIQEMEYKPFIQRIKDYLIGMACVAILLLLMNLAVAKLQAARKVRKSMAQYQNMLNKNGVGDYPTI